MRIEMIPLILGVLVALVGVGLVADAWLPEEMIVPHPDRRRSPREERHLGGEAAVGLGVLCIAAALMGRDTWSLGTVASIAGAVLVLWGGWLNRRYLRERITNRGALRRVEPGERPVAKRTTPPPGRPRIR